MHIVASLTILAVLGMPLSIVCQIIDPNSVDRALRTTWCDNQKTSCPLLCSQVSDSSTSVRENYCDPSTLVYSCVCKNGQSPNASEYSQTIPYYICTEANTQCVDDCGNNAACQSACREDNPCGAQNPTPANKTASSTRSATATSSDEPSSTDGDEVFDGFAGAAGSPSGSSSGNTNINAGSVAIDLGRSFGLGAVALGIFAGFAIVL